MSESKIGEISLVSLLIKNLLDSYADNQFQIDHFIDLLDTSDLLSVNKLSTIGWQRLHDLLKNCHILKHDYSIISKIITLFDGVKRQFSSVTDLVTLTNTHDELLSNLVNFGMPKKPAEKFINTIYQYYFKQQFPHDYLAARKVARILKKYGFDGFIIGGAVRDIYLGREPKDFDLVTNATPDQIELIAEFKKTIYKDSAQAYGVTRVKIDEFEVEVATFRRDLEAHLGRKATVVEFADLEDDVMRRDFTINALALDLANDSILDYVDGISDIDNKIIRFIGDGQKRIIEDPLRIMRAVRFRNQLDFNYESDTFEAIKNKINEGYVEKIAVDRLRDELTNLLIHESRQSALIDLDELGILNRILSEVTACKNVAQPSKFHSEGDVWHHELLIMSYLPENPSRQLAWAALLHDIGKVPTHTPPTNKEDRIHFNNHYEIGAEMTENILRRLNFSNNDIQDICWMVRNHMSIDDLPKMRPSARREFLNNRAFSDLLELHRADAASSWRPNVLKNHRPKFMELEKMWHEYKNQTPEQITKSLKHDLGFDGNWLVKNFGDLPGPIIGEVMNELNEWYLDEGVKSESKYLRRAKKIINDITN